MNTYLKYLWPHASVTALSVKLIAASCDYALKMFHEWKNKQKGHSDNPERNDEVQHWYGMNWTLENSTCSISGNNSGAHFVLVMSCSISVLVTKIMLVALRLLFDLDNCGLSHLKQNKFLPHGSGIVSQTVNSCVECSWLHQIWVIYFEHQEDQLHLD